MIFVFYIEDRVAQYDNDVICIENFELIDLK